MGSSAAESRQGSMKARRGETYRQLGDQAVLGNRDFTCRTTVRCMERKALTDTVASSSDQWFCSARCRVGSHRQAKRARNG